MTRSTIVTMALGFTLIAVPAAIAASFPVKVLNALTSRKGYAIEAEVAYGGHSRQRMDIYLPDDVAPDAPVIVFFYGGGWNRGARADYLFVGQSLASAGFIVAIPDYRLYPEVVFPEFVADGAKAVGFVRGRFDKPGGTARPIFLAGHSAGAHIAALLNLDEHYLASADVPRNAIAGAVGLSGPYDFLPLEEDIYKATFPEAVRAASQPIAFVDGSEAPMLLITGDADRTVRPGNTTRLAAAVVDKGGAAEVKIYPGVGHLGTVAALATATPWRKPDIRETMIAFFRKHSSGVRRAPEG
jgi:acetyl esterase/lipase